MTTNSKSEGFNATIYLLRLHAYLKKRTLKATELGSISCTISRLIVIAQFKLVCAIFVMCVLL